MHPMRLRQIVRIDVLGAWIALRIAAAKYRLVAQLLVLDQRADRIQAKARDTAVQPERIISNIVRSTCGLRQLRSGCCR